ncbi:hypothetical protein EV356DRAFT_503446 [Viridothelium virens]|uniref:Myb-like domain-containing protein n=1 Tax=Viridothelium virens TaxID=1048519 RepID=A0A6A6H6R0_VIRVR|nr:hypothetical protein EV356DRAFT_503446 [Viridothelium virens]
MTDFRGFDSFVNYDEAIAMPVTPRKRVKQEISDDGATPVPLSKVPRKETTPDTTAASRDERSPKPDRASRHKGTPIMLSSSGELSQLDKDIIFLYEEKGKTWDQIRKWYTRQTGETPGKSTLGNRYARIKAAGYNFTENDNQLLIESKAEVEAAFEKEKWPRISDLMAEKGSSRKYNVQTLQKQWKKAEKARKPLSDRSMIDES